MNCEACQSVEMFIHCDIEKCGAVRHVATCRDCGTLNLTPKPTENKTTTGRSSARFNQMKEAENGTGN
jgi:ribosomal protein L40E